MARKPLFKRLPDVFHRLDTDGVLQRYLSVMDSGFDHVHDKAGELFDLRSVDECPDRWLPMLGELVGHVWRQDKSRQWNRDRIRDCVRRYSYKGTTASIEDLIREHGGGPWEILDMASQLLVWNRQGCWSRGDSHFIAADYWHDGAFLLRISDQVNLNEFIADFELTKPAGEKWFIEVSYDSVTVSESATYTEVELIEDSPGLLYGRWNQDLFFDWAPPGDTDVSFEPIIYLDSVDRPGGLWGEDLFWNRPPAGVTSVDIQPIIYLDSVDRPGSLWNEDLVWNREPAGATGVELNAENVSACGYLFMDSVIGMDRQDITLDMGSPAKPLPLEINLTLDATEATLEEI
jgi:phage tail-like protein